MIRQGLMQHRNLDGFVDAVVAEADETLSSWARAGEVTSSRDLAARHLYQHPHAHGRAHP